MAVLNDNALIGASGQSKGYQVSRSLRFNAPDSGSLSRNFSSASNRKTWTWSAWVKRGKLGSGEQILFYAISANTGAPYNFATSFGFTDDTLFFANAANNIYKTAAVLRDPSAWYHIVVVLDTTQAATSDRVKFYVNNQLITKTFQGNSGAAEPTQNLDYAVNTNNYHSIGSYIDTSGTNNYTPSNLSAYLADVHFIDGSALTPSSFAETDSTTSQWVPKLFSGSYGSQGWKLTFADNSNNTAATLGADSSGNGNNWTPNNFSVTAGAGNDALTDSPTSYGSGTSGGDVRGNFCTWNPLTGNTYSASYKNGNLDFDSSVGADGLHVFSTFQLPSTGKWYWETVYSQGSGFVGINSNATLGNNTQLSTMKTYYSNGDIGGTGGNATWGVNDVIGSAYDADAGTLKFYKNGTLQATTISGVGFSNGPWWAQLRQDNNCISSTNFGQRPFAYPVSGFKALCDTNLPDPLIKLPSTVMDVKRYDGNGSTQTVSGLGFSPDLVWAKSRSSAAGHGLFDSVRGVSKSLSSHVTDVEGVGAAGTGVSAFNSDGFSLGPYDAAFAGNINPSGSSQVAWCWDAGSSTVTLNPGDPGAGSISSQVRANASSGFSVTTFSASADGDVGHGLGVKPGLIILKNRDQALSWAVWHQSFTSPQRNYLYLNTTDAVGDAGVDIWGTSSYPNSNTFWFRYGSWASGGSRNLVAYCFAPVTGYSNAFSFVGNGSTDGPAVWLGFRPRFVILKASSSTSHWHMMDSARQTYNQMNTNLFANLSNAELSDPDFQIDFLSNGFKLRTSGPSMNGSGVTYIGYAWAENPFQYARAR